MQRDEQNCMVLNRRETQALYLLLNASLSGKPMNLGQQAWVGDSRDDATDMLQLADNMETALQSTK